MAIKTALVVDDSKSARFALRRFLETKGYTVDTAEGASEAFGYLKSKRPDVVFLDHMMPGINGFEALRTIRMEMDLISLPVIICSSNEGEAFVREARAQGADDVLPKPPNELHIDAVLARVREAPKPTQIPDADLIDELIIEPPPKTVSPEIVMPPLAATPPPAEIQVKAPAPPSPPSPPPAAAVIPPPPKAAPEPAKPTTGAPKMDQKVGPAEASAGKGSELERKLKELADKIDGLQRTVDQLSSRLEPVLRPAPAASQKSSDGPLDPSLSKVSRTVVESSRKLSDINAYVQSIIDRSDV